MRRLIMVFLLLILGLSNIPAVQAQNVSVHLTLGNPSATTTDTTLPNNYLITRPQYALAYNNDYGTPRWVSWHLDLRDLGPVPRCNCFKSDGLLPGGWNKVTESNYTNSGFDRGHITASEDRTATDADNEATFYMTNVIPQVPAANRGPWARLEDASRDLTHDNATPAQPVHEVYIVSGPVGSLGRLPSGNVVIPAASWKAELVLPFGEDDLQRITTATRVIAIRVPNSSTVLQSDPWEQYRSTVDAIEAETQIDLFNAIDPKIQRVLEARTDTGPLTRTLTLVSGDQQSAIVNTGFPTALSIVVQDANNQPVPGVAVVFAALGDTATAHLSIDDTQVTVLTDANGQASVQAGAIGVAGSYRVEASIDGVYTPVVFKLINLELKIKRVALPFVLAP